MFDCIYVIALQAMQGNQASYHGEGEVSEFFSSCGRDLFIYLSYGGDVPSKLVFLQ